MSREFDILKINVETTLKDLGVPLQNARVELATFYARFEQPYVDALAAGDKLSLDLLRDQLAMALGRASYKTLHKYREMIMSVVLTTARTIIGLVLKPT